MEGKLTAKFDRLTDPVLFRICAKGQSCERESGKSTLGSWNDAGRKVQNT